jgi:Xaa-Pro aminopeptidase
MIPSLQANLKTLGLDALLITKPENVFYLTGFRGSFGQFFLTVKQCYLITDFRYLIRAKKELQSKKNLFSVEIVEVVEAKKIIERHKQIGFEENHLTVSYLKQIKKKYPNSKWRGVAEIIENKRYIKTETEIKKIKKAAAIGDKVMRRLPQIMRLGMTEKDLVWEIKRLIHEYGGDDVSFPPIVAFGKNSAIPHHESGNTKLKTGDMVLFDFGVKYQGYCSDLTRIVFTTPPRDKELKIYNIVLEAQKRALEFIKPGVIIADLDKKARDFIQQNKYAAQFGHALGHGVGIEIHEKPTVNFNNKDKLEEGMVITIEPGIYIEGMGGIRIEDLVVVRKERAEILSQCSKKVIINNST